MPCVVLFLKLIAGCILIVGVVKCVDHMGGTIAKVKVRSFIDESSVLNSDSVLVIGRISQLILYGENITSNVDIALTNEPSEPGAPCSSPLNIFVNKELKCSECTFKELSVTLTERKSYFLKGEKNVWLCARTRFNNSSNNYTNVQSEWIQQGHNIQIADLEWFPSPPHPPRARGRLRRQAQIDHEGPLLAPSGSIAPLENSDNETGGGSSSFSPLTHQVAASSQSANEGLLQSNSPIHEEGASYPDLGKSHLKGAPEGLAAIAPVPLVQGVIEDDDPTLYYTNISNENVKTKLQTNEHSENNDFSHSGKFTHGANSQTNINQRTKNSRNPVNKVRKIQARSADLKRLSYSEMAKDPAEGDIIGQGLPLELLRDDEVNLFEEANRTLVRVSGLRVEYHPKGFEHDGAVTMFLAGYESTIRLYGEGLDTDIYVQFTALRSAFGGQCDVSTTEAFKVESAGGSWALVRVTLPVMSDDQDAWHLCLRESMDDRAIHQGNFDWLAVQTYSLPLPMWVQVIILIILLILSGLFSGLNLGLMALDKTELEIVQNTGSPTERRYAKSIAPVRRHGNFLLCTLLLGNVLVNSTLTILLDNLSTGLIAIIGSTSGIVIFGEIVPQAICSRHGLAIGARTVWLVRIFMVLTGIIAWPISKILDCVLGEELGNTYDRDRLKELIRVTQDRNDIRKEEQNIICGALELHKKTVAEVMTRLEDVYMLPVDTILDFDKISEIMQQGYSRLPIFEGERNNIVSVLFIKDLAFIDPDDNTPLRTLTQFYQNSCNFVFADTTLDVMFKEFKEGNKGHMAFVQRVNSEGDGDPFYEILGLVTLEDVIEELIQEEIVDETDVITDNRTRRRRKDHKRRDFTEFSQINPHQKKVLISPQMQVAALQFLRTSVDPFKEGQLSESILKKLLTQRIIHVIKPQSKDVKKDELHNFIYMQGKPADFFILILEGHVEVTIGKESITFDSGPFTFFGLTALNTNSMFSESPSSSMQLNRGSIQSLESNKMTFSPDYSVKVIGEVTFLKLRRPHYIAARRAYLLEKSKRDPQAESNFEKEMIKILKDEALTCPVWENSMVSEPETTDNLLNGDAIRTRSQEESLELATVNERSLRGSMSRSKRKSKGDNLSSPTTPSQGRAHSLNVTDSCDDLTSLTCAQKDPEEES